MKKYILSLAVIFSTVLSAYPQKIIDKKIEVNAKKVEMKLSFAEKISIEAWDNNYIEFHVSANLDDNNYNDYYSLVVKESGKEIMIVEDVDFDGIKKKYGAKTLHNFSTEINYTLKVPSTLEFDLNTISGEVELAGCQGEMAINSVSGFIDYSIPLNHKANIDLSTVTGNVYSNVKFDKSPEKEISWVGTNQELTLNGGSVPVELKTVSGDIFLRKY
jgi:hypothetical protein